MFTLLSFVMYNLFPHPPTLPPPPPCALLLITSRTLQEFCDTPMFISGDASRFDVSQGFLGDCWLVAAIASLTQDKILFNTVSCSRGLCRVEMCSLFTET